MRTKAPGIRTLAAKWAVVEQAMIEAMPNETGVASRTMHRWLRHLFYVGAGSTLDLVGEVPPDELRAEVARFLEGLSAANPPQEEEPGP